MASPAAAGSGALIRQYFVDQTFRYWTTVCNSAYSMCKSFTPSGTIVNIPTEATYYCHYMIRFRGFTEGYIITLREEHAEQLQQRQSAIPWISPR